MRKKVLTRLCIGLAVLGGLHLLLNHIDYHWNWRVAWDYRALFITGFYYTIVVSMGAILLVRYRAGRRAGTLPGTSRGNRGV
jgi:polar amino acid transport system permease protein